MLPLQRPCGADREEIAWSTECFGRHARVVSESIGRSSGRKPLFNSLSPALGLLSIRRGWR